MFRSIPCLTLFALAFLASDVHGENAAAPLLEHEPSTGLKDPNEEDAVPVAPQDKAVFKRLLPKAKSKQHSVRAKSEQHSVQPKSKQHSVQAKPKHHSKSEHAAGTTDGEGDIDIRPVGQTEHQTESPTDQHRIYHPQKPSDVTALLILESGLLGPDFNGKSLSEIKAELSTPHFKSKLAAFLTKWVFEAKGRIDQGNEMLQSVKRMHSLFEALYAEEMAEAKYKGSRSGRRSAMPYATRSPYVEEAEGDSGDLLYLAMMFGCASFIVVAMVQKLIERKKQRKIESEGDTTTSLVDV